MSQNRVPFFRPHLSDCEVEEVVDTLRSGWLTTGPKVTKFEQAFAAATRSQHAVALNSCTAALHLALEALEVQPGDAVLVPTMTFAATAEVVRYLRAIPILVDCDPITLNLDLEDASHKIRQLKKGNLSPRLALDTPVVGIMPVHVGGFMMNSKAVIEFATSHNLWIVEDAAHAFPAAWREDANAPWQLCGENTATVSCFSFYANKTITTGEGGMAVTENDALARRMRSMSLHGLSHDAWGRYSERGSWDYRIMAPGFKYNLTDIAAAIGIHQLERAEQLRQEREANAKRYFEAFADVAELELPIDDPNRLHSWHLFPIRLVLERLQINRDVFIEELKGAGVGCSVHWRPLHLHPYYAETFGWKKHELPVASSVWQRLVSLPIYPGMSNEEFLHVVETVKSICLVNSRRTRRTKVASM